MTFYMLFQPFPLIPRRNPLCSDELLYGPILAQKIPTLRRSKIHRFCVEKFGQTHFFRGESLKTYRS